MKTIVVGLLAACALAAPVLAQTADERSVQSSVEDFLTRLGDGRYETLEADFTPKAIVFVARERDGAWASNYQTAEEWLAGLKKNPNPIKFREPIANVKITLDSGQLAYLRADFQVVRDGKTLSSGVDQFTLVRDGTRWRLAAIVYTSMPAGK